MAERLLHEESKTKDRITASSQEGPLVTKFSKRPICYFCHKRGHIKKDCEQYAKAIDKPAQARKKTMGAFKVTIIGEDENGSDIDSCSLLEHHALIGGPNTTSQWILDSGSTCHMCNNETVFDDLQALSVPLNVTLRNGRNLQAVGRGNVTLKRNLQGADLHSPRCSSGTSAGV